MVVAMIVTKDPDYLSDLDMRLSAIRIYGPEYFRSGIFSAVRMSGASILL